MNDVFPTTTDVPVVPVENEYNAAITTIPPPFAPGADTLLLLNRLLRTEASTHEATVE
jgi:hypothetical protein